MSEVDKIIKFLKAMGLLLFFGRIVNWFWVGLVKRVPFLHGLFYHPGLDNEVTASDWVIGGFRGIGVGLFILVPIFCPIIIVIMAMMNSPDYARISVRLSDNPVLFIIIGPIMLFLGYKFLLFDRKTYLDKHQPQMTREEALEIWKSFTPEEKKAFETMARKSGLM